MPAAGERPAGDGAGPTGLSQHQGKDRVYSWEVCRLLPSNLRGIINRESHALYLRCFAMHALT